MRTVRRSVAGFIAGIVAFAVLAGGSGAAWAHWTATAQGSAQVTTPSVRISQTNFTVLRATFTNAHARQTSTGSFTITNDGTVAGVASTRISATGTIAARMPMRMWPVASAGACTAAATIPASAATGTWASTVFEGTPLAAGQSQIFCVRTTIPLSQRNGLASATGNATAPGTLEVSLAASGAGWTAASSPAFATQTMSAIYPLETALAPLTASRWHVLRSAGNSGACLDVNASGGTGSIVISWACTRTAEGSAASNQLWQVVPVSESDPSLVTLRPRHAPTARLAVESSGRQIIAAANATATAQQWFVQRVSPTSVQLVSALDGRCFALPATTGTGALSLVDCSLPTTVLVAPERIPLGFSTTATATTLTVGAQATGALLTLQRWTGTAWSTVTTTTAAGSIAFPPGSSLELGDNTMRIVFADGTVAYNLVLNWSGTTVSPVSGMG